MITLTSPSLSLEQYQYSDTGVVLNTDATLPFVDIVSVQGLDSAPIREQTHDREGADGGYVDAEFETIRTVTLEGQAYADPSTVETYLDSLKANFAPVKVPKALYFGTDAGVRAVVGKSLGFNYSKDQMRRLGIIEFQVQIRCEDPRVYSPSLITASGTLSAELTSGRGYNKGYNFGYGAAGSASGVAVNIGGNRPTPGIVRINGPVRDPSFLFDPTGAEFRFTTVLAAGDWIDVDLDNKTVMRNGTGNMRNALKIYGNWFLFQPGLNTVRFFGVQDPPTPAATIQIMTYSAWR